MQDRQKAKGKIRITGSHKFVLHKKFRERIIQKYEGSTNFIFISVFIKYQQKYI